MNNYEEVDNIVETTTYTTYGTPSKRTVVETTTYRSPSSPLSPSKTTIVTRKNPSINPHTNNVHAHTPLVSAFGDEYDRRVETTYSNGDVTTEEYVSSPTRGDTSPRGRKTPVHTHTTYSSVEPSYNRLPELSSMYSPTKVTEVTTVSPSRSTRTIQYVSSPRHDATTQMTHVVSDTTVDEINDELDRTRARMEEVSDIFQLHASIRPGEPLYGFPYNTSPTRSGPAHETVIVKQVSPTKTVTTTHISPIQYAHPVQYVTTTSETPIKYVTSVSPVKTTTISSPGWAYRSGVAHDLLD